MVHDVDPSVFEQTEASYRLYAINRWKPPRRKTFVHFKHDKGRASTALLCPDKQHAGGGQQQKHP